MLSIPGQVKIFLAVEPADRRQGFDRLAARVSQTFQADPLSGHLFVFRNRRADRLKLPLQRAPRQTLPARRRDA